MRTFIKTASVIGIIAFAGLASSASGEQETLPVRLEYSVPANVRTGDEVTTVITFRALENLDRLEVSVAPFKGLELISETREATFTNVKRGEGRQLTVTIRLTDPKFGSLAVLYHMVQGTMKISGARTIVYGNPGA